jgi:elongation factor Ts
MSTISPAAVKALRDKTNAPMMACKSALTEANGDMAKAVDIIRTKFKDAVVKFGDREAAEGRIAVHIDPAKKVGVIVELRCESAPVTKSEQFIALANFLAHEAAENNIDSAEALAARPKAQEKITETVGLIRENMKVARVTRLTGGVMGSYIHHDGTTGVLIQAEGTKSDEQVLRDVCMHIVARNPQFGRREDVPAEVIEKEKGIALTQVQADPKNANKPANILEKITEGKLKTWFGEYVLVEQPFVKDDTKTVGDVLKGAGLKLVKFVRYKVGEKS